MSFLDDAGVTKLTSYLKGKIQTLLSKKQDTLISGTNIKSINGNSMLGSGNIAIKGSSWYGTSSTAATTATKSVTCGGYVLQTGGGTLVCVTFSTANTYVSGALKLNVNSTGAKNIYVNNAVTSSSNTLTWDAGECLTFVYSGSYYYFVGRSKAQSGGGLLVTVETDQVPPRLSATFREIYNAVVSGNGFVYTDSDNYYNNWGITSTMEGSEYNDISLFSISNRYPHAFRAESFDDYPTYKTSGGG